MTISTDTTSILAVWGETVTIVRNSPSYDNAGVMTDSWSSSVTGTATADIQPIAGITIQRENGEQRTMSHRLYFPSGTNIRQGDRIRPSGWVAGNDEYVAESVSSDEGHVEVLATLTSGHA